MLLPILLVDIVNPVLFAFLVYAAGTDRGVRTSSAMLLGHTAAYLAAGVVLALFMDRIADYFAEPQWIDFAIQLVLAAVLLWVAFKSRNDSGKRPRENEPRLNTASAFGFGAVVNFIGIPFAVPYFAAIDQVLKADLDDVQAFGMLLAYNLAYAVPFALVPILTAVLGSRAAPLLSDISGWLDKVSAALMPWILGLLGLVLLADAVLYFVYGAPLF